MPLPSVTSGLQWWFDARDITGVSDGSPVSGWADSTGNGHDAAISTGSATYHADQFNGGAALTFANCSMDISGAVTPTGVFTIFAVYRITALNNSQTILGCSAAGIEYRLVLDSGGMDRLQFAFSRLGTNFEGVGTAPADTRWHQSSLAQNHSSSLAFRVDGTDDTVLASGGWASGNPAPTLIGASNGGAFFAGQVQAVGYYNRLLTDLEIASVETDIAIPTPPPIPPVVPPPAPVLIGGDANLAADGGDRRWLDIQLPFTISVSMAQRLEKIELMRRRQQGTGTFSYNMAMYKTTALDIIRMNLPLLGWYGKLLEIAAHRLTLNKQAVDGVEATLLGCEIDVQETDPSIYDWSVSEELTLQGGQQPNPPGNTVVAPPTDVVAVSGADVAVIGANGVAASRILITWTPPADALVNQIQLQYRPADSLTWTALGSVGQTITQFYINGVTDGVDYTAQVRAVNVAGIPSVWVEASVTAEGSSTPEILFTDDGNPILTDTGQFIYV